MRNAIVLAVLAAVGAPSAAQLVSNCPPCCSGFPAAATQPVALSEAARQALLDLRREEKLAHDVYVTLAGVCNLPPLRRIPQAELRHAQAIRFLMDRYEVADPLTSLPTGKFDDPATQKMFDDYVSRGEASAVAALRVAAEIEERDIADLKAFGTNFATRDDQMRFVIDNLSSASRNHLRAFVRNLEARGVEYAPVCLDAKAFKQIMQDGDAWSRGGIGRGRGQRWRK